MPAPISSEPTSGNSVDPNAVPIWKTGTLTYTRSALSRLFCWLLGGDFAINIRGSAMGPLTQLLLRNHHASDTLVGFINGSLPCGIGVILGPWLSVLSDRHRGPRGRRIPFLMAGAPFATLAPIGFAFSPVLGKALDVLLGASSPGFNPCVLIVFLFFVIIFDIANGFTGTGFGGLINDVVPHEVIGRFNGLFRAVHLAAGVLFNYFVMASVETHSFWTFITTSLLYGVGMWSICFKVKEGKYPPPPPKAPNPWAGISTYFKECYSRPYYLLVFTTLLIAGLSFAPVNSFSLFYAKSIGMSVGTYGKFLALTYSCSFCLAYPFGHFADRFHPLPMGIVCMLCYALTAFWGGFFATDTTTFAIAFVLHGVISGCYASATASLTQRLFPRDRFAQFHSAAGIFGTPFWMLLPLGVGMALDWSGHNYRYTFLMSGTLAAAATVFLTILLTQMKRFGGVRHYEAPQ